MAAEKIRKERVDVLVVEQGLAETREKAQALILAGKVHTGDRKLDKPGLKIDAALTLRLQGDQDPYVSRGAYKLLGAIDAFHIDLKNKRCLDIGASTGGFTQVCLEKGANKVIAVDVGHNQMHWKIKSDPRVICIEGVNMREEQPTIIGDDVDFVCIDTSFISLRLILPTAVRHLRGQGECVALVKPQHEVRKEEVGKGGIVKDPMLHERVKKEITEFAQSIGFEVRGLIQSPLIGTSGNIEFLMYCQKAK